MNRPVEIRRDQVEADRLGPERLGENTTCVQVTDPRCATCGGAGAAPDGAVCGPCAVPVRLMARIGPRLEREDISSLVIHGRALIPLPGCATCSGTGRDQTGPCLPCAVVYRP